MRTNEELARELDEYAGSAILDGDEERLIEECAARLRADSDALQALTTLTEKAIGTNVVGVVAAADAKLEEELREVLALLFGPLRVDDVVAPLAGAIANHVDAKVLAFGAMIMEKLGVQGDE